MIPIPIHYLYRPQSQAWVEKPSAFFDFREMWLPFSTPQSITGCYILLEIRVKSFYVL